jgi:enoyl-CoA hydratase
VADILFATEGAIGLVTLNRPQALNALTLDMALALDRQLHAWEGDRTVRAVVIRGAGDRAFCAGGDIRALYESGMTKKNDLTRQFYWHEYRVNRRIKRYPKPYIALMDGVTMGGGVGVSVHGSHRVATAKTVFAMPETGIGLFPDVGGSHFLPRCPGKTGLYMALTGARLSAADCLHAGIATHAAASERLDALVAALAAADFAADDRGAVDGVLAKFATDAGPSQLATSRREIDGDFSDPTIEDVEGALRKRGGGWAEAVLKAMAEKSPLSQKVALRQLERGAAMSFEDCMVMEYRLSQRAMAGHDFYEGVRAAVIDKDRSPKWRPPSLGEVSDAQVEAWFAPLPEGDLRFD